MQRLVDPSVQRPGPSPQPEPSPKDRPTLTAPHASQTAFPPANPAFLTVSEVSLKVSLDGSSACRSLAQGLFPRVSDMESFPTTLKMLAMQCFNGVVKT